MNALKPRPFRRAETVGILTPDAVAFKGETAEQLSEVLQAFVSSWKPVGQMEYVLVEKMTIAYWRMRRILRAESANITAREYGIPGEGGRPSETALLSLRKAIPKSARYDAETWAGLEGKRSGVPERSFLQDFAAYELLMEREFYRAVRTLERLQASRLGELSPRMTVEYDGL